MSAPGQGILDVVTDGVVRLEDVVDRDALTELCRSIQRLFGLGVRVYSADGALLASAASEQEICLYLNEFAPGRMACGSTVSAAKSVSPEKDGEVTHVCFTGLCYRIVTLEHEKRHVGRVVIGPFAPAGLREVPESLPRALPMLEAPRSKALLARVPRVKDDALARLANHMKTTLELIIFSSHKAYVTSKLHLYSVRESYRELEEKTGRLEQALKRLKELDRLKSNFLATVSHELRTPLTSIIGYSEMLVEGLAGEMTTEQHEFVRTIHEKGEQLLALIMGLLDLSKLESGTMRLRQLPTRVETVLTEVVSTLTPVARKKGVELLLEMDGAALEMGADPERLRQVFVNLVDNAVKFTPPGGRVTITSKATTRMASGSEEEEGGAILLAPIRRDVVVTVADTGIGIPSGERDKVFDAFYQVDSSSTRVYGGTGLGLSIVKRIVEAHGGEVHVEANQPHGAVFVVTLPTAQARRLPSRVPAVVVP